MFIIIIIQAPARSGTCSEESWRMRCIECGRPSGENRALHRSQRCRVVSRMGPTKKQVNYLVFGLLRRRFVSSAHLCCTPRARAPQQSSTLGRTVGSRWPPFKPAQAHSCSGLFFFLAKLNSNVFNYHTVERIYPRSMSTPWYQYQSRIPVATQPHH